MNTPARSQLLCVCLLAAAFAAVPAQANITPAEVSAVSGTPELIWTVSSTSDGPAFTAAGVTKVGSTIEWQTPTADSAATTYQLWLTTTVTGPKQAILTAAGNSVSGISITKQVSFWYDSFLGQVTTRGLASASDSISIMIPPGQHTLTMKGLMTNTSGSMIEGKVTISGFSVKPALFVEAAKVVCIGEPVSLPVQAGVPASLSASGLPPGISLMQTGPDSAVLTGRPTAAGVYNVALSGASSGSTMSGATTITVVASGGALATALDAPDLCVYGENWTVVTGTETGVPVQPKVHNGPTATWSGGPTSTPSWIEAVVSGPGTLSWHYLNLDPGNPYQGSYSVTMDGAALAPAFVVNDGFWTKESAAIGYGMHRLRWNRVPDSRNTLATRQLDGFLFQRPANFPAWAAGLPAGKQDDLADPDGDGVSNLLEYALGGDPTSPASAPRPSITMTAGRLVCDVLPVAGVTGITYGARWTSSFDASSWLPLPDTGTGGSHVFTTPPGGTRQFIQCVITRP